MTVEDQRAPAGHERGERAREVDRAVDLETIGRVLHHEIEPAPEPRQPGDQLRGLAAAELDSRDPVQAEPVGRDVDDRRIALDHGDSTRRRDLAEQVELRAAAEADEER